MKNSFYVLLILIFSGISNAYSQNNHGFSIALNRSLEDGDEYYNAGINFIVLKKLHIETSFGVRNANPISYNLSASFEYDFYSQKPHFFKFRTYIAGFMRDDSFFFDERYLKQAVGFGYLNQLYDHWGYGIDYNFIGWYFGTRVDQRKPHTPSLFEAGEFRAKIIYFF